MAPAAVETIRRNKAIPAQYSLLQLALPAQPIRNIGVLLFDPARGELFHKLMPDWEKVAGPEDVELLSRLDEDFQSKIREMGGAQFLSSLEDTLSNSLLLTERQAVSVSDFETALDRLFAEHVVGRGREKAKVIPFVTHLPLFSLRAAATKFGEDAEVEEEGWVEAPSRLRLSEDMFVARVVGRSMEPRIPDGSLCIFRARVVGSRQGKLLLVEMRGTTDTSARYTIKRYSSVKTSAGEEEWQHSSIRLEPLNPEFEAFELGEGQFRVLGEFVQVLSEEI